MKLIPCILPLVLASLSLAQRAGDRQAVAGTHPSYTITNIKPAAITWAIGAMDFMSDGRLVITSWRDPYEVYILSNAIVGSNPTSATMTKFATGLTESLGLKVVNDSIYVLQKDEITLLLDHDKDGTADEYRAISYDWTKSVNSKEYAMGLAFDGTWFYAAFGDPTISSGTSIDPVPAGRQNGVLRVRRSDGHTEVFTGGLRVPGGVSMAFGQVWVTEIQGGYRPSNVLYSPKAGRWYGRPVNPPSMFQPANVGNPNTVNKPYSTVEQLYGPSGFQATPFALNIPFKTSSVAGGGPAGLQRSPAQPVEIKTGPFAGQMLIPESDRGENGSGEMVRAYIEKMPNGEYQGAVFHFTRNTAFGSNLSDGRACFAMIEGPDGSLYCSGNGANAAGWTRATNVGLDRIKLSGAATPFDILAVRNMGATSFEVEFTKPLAASLGNDVSANLVVQNWWDQLSETYGCCRRNAASTSNGVATVTGMTATVQSNRSKVTITFPTALSQFYTYYLRWSDNMKSEANETLYGTEAWYTLNTFGPGSAVVAVDGNRSISPDAPFTVNKMAGGVMRVKLFVTGAAPYKVTITSLKGQTFARRSGNGAGDLIFQPGELPTGIAVLKIQAGDHTYSRLLSR